MKQYQPVFAFLIGVGVAFGAGSLLTGKHHHGHLHEGSHPVGYAEHEDEVHVHSDFVVSIAGETIDLSDDRFMTSSTQTLHPHIHLHDNNGNIIHRHEHDITLGAFFESLGFPLTNDCITTEAGVEYCTNDKQALLLFVNGVVTPSIADYVNQEEDQLLVYYGSPNAPEIPELLEAVSDESCVYSGTCPERGVAPPESCGLTCEL
ncbi:MAG: hypothetical protein AAGA35_03195 [Patescibacteria group bacterium]